MIALKKYCIDTVLLEGFEVKKEFDEHQMTWKELRIKSFIQVFKDFVNSTEARNPPLVNDVQDKIMKDQEPILKERII